MKKNSTRDTTKPKHLPRLRAILWTGAVLAFTLYPIIELTRFIIEYSTLYGWNALRIAEITTMWPLYITGIILIYHLASRSAKNP